MTTAPQTLWMRDCLATKAMAMTVHLKLVKAVDIAARRTGGVQSVDMAMRIGTDQETPTTVINSNTEIGVAVEWYAATVAATMCGGTGHDHHDCFLPRILFAALVL